MESRLQYSLRMDVALKERIRAEAKRAARSVNNEIVHRLRQSLEAQDATQETAA